MNRRGQLFMVGAMLSFIAFFLAVIFIEPLKEGAELARTDLNCTSSSLSTGVELTCIVIDIYLFVFVFALLGVGIGFIGLRKVGLLGGG